MGTRAIIVKNISANLLLQLITALGGFILPPLIVVTYGSATNGMLASIKQFITYLTLLEAGVGAAAIVALYQALSQHNLSLRNRILAAARHFYHISGGLFALGLVILAGLFAWLTQEQISARLTFWMVLVMGAINIMDFFLFGAYRALLTADQKTYVISAVQAASVLVVTALCYFLIKAGYSILTVQAAATLVQLVKLLCYRRYVQQHYPDLQPDPAQPRYHLHQTWDALTHQLTGLLIFSSPLVLITLFLSLKDASIYAVYALVFAAIKMALQSMSQGMQAVFGHSLHEDMTASRRHYARYECLFWCFLGWCYSCTALLFMPFIQVYTQKMTDADYQQPLLALLFLLVGIVENSRIPAMTLIMGAGRYKATKPAALFEASLNLVCSIWLIQLWGLAGLLVAALVSFLYRSNDMIYYTSKHILSLPVWRSYAVLLPVLLLMLVVILAGWPLLAGIAVTGYVAWLCLSVVTALVVIVPFILLYFLMNRWSLR
ncbi:hypothetical protein PT286_00105 [Neisseriaceae bacterium ESL0693]|nr:hypothetical protein [Neisseriaceae bacterium ESL0693]